MLLFDPSEKIKKGFLMFSGRSKGNTGKKKGNFCLNHSHVSKLCSYKIQKIKQLALQSLAYFWHIHYFQVAKIKV